MVKHLQGGVLLALFLMASSAPASAAKPPDLPVAVEQEFDLQEPAASEQTERIQGNFEFYSGLLPYYPTEGQNLTPQRCPVPACTHGQYPVSSRPHGFVDSGETISCDRLECSATQRCRAHEQDDYCGQLIRHFWRGVTHVLDGSFSFSVAPCVPMGLMHLDMPCPGTHLVPGALFGPGDCVVPLTPNCFVGEPMAQPFPLGGQSRPVQLVVPPAAPMEVGVLTDSVESLHQLAESRKLYEVAEFYLKTGQAMTAYHYYQETHIHSPLSRHGQVALSKMLQIEASLIQARVNVNCKHVGPDGLERVGCDFEACTVTACRVPTDNERYLQQLGQAQDMYHIAERCRTRGDLDKAYTCYHETQRLCPDSDYAHLAGKHIRRLDMLRDVQQAQDDENSDAENAGETGPMELEQLLPMFLPFIPDLFGVSYWLPAEGSAVEHDDLEVCEPEASAQDERGDCPCCRRNHGCLRTTYKHARPQHTDAEECRVEDVARSLEINAWLLHAVRVLGGTNTHVELDVNTTSPNGLRVHGGLFFGCVGCQVICEGDSVRVVCPALRGMR